MKSLTPEIPFLLAKWRDYDPDTKSHFKVRGFNLPGHLGACMWMGRYLLHHCQFGSRLFEVMKLDRFTTEETFFRLCLLSVLCHDLGKAGHEFQTFLWQLEHAYLAWEANPSGEFKKPFGKDRYRQAYRHEALSAVLMRDVPAIWEWLVQETGSEEYATIVISGSFGHHRKTDLERAVKNHEDKKPQRIFLREVSELLAAICPKYGFRPFPICDDIQLAPKDVFSKVRDFHCEHMDDKEETPLSAAVKFVTILSDSLGSMSPKNPRSIPRYHRNLERCLDDICGKKGSKPKPIRFRRHLEAKGWQKFRRKLFPFQQKARAVGAQDDAVLVAPCGRGKTIAGYLWACRRPDLKLVFTTPTTATATQINIDYQKDGKAGVRHSRFAVDEALKRQGIWKKEEHQILRTGKDLTGEDINLPATPEQTLEEQIEVDAEYAGLVDDFKGFGFEVTHATVDQVLGLLAYSHRSVMWLLYLVNAQIVFDEFHYYDHVMQQWFTKFLTWFPGIRIKCMSATIADLQMEAVLKARPKATVILDDDNDGPAKRPRYRIHVLKDRQEAQAHFTPGTLWIANQVKVAQSIGVDNPEAIICHSRYSYRDRIKIQQAMVSGFRGMRKGKTAISAITTQVAEISIDISASSMISEIVDPASAIQRLGRLNREAYPAQVAHAYFYMPEDGRPYHPKGSLSAFENHYEPWLRSLEGRDLSQEDLDKAFRQYKGFSREDLPVSFPLTETIRRPIRQQQTATLGIWAKHLPADPKEWKRLRLSELQEIEMPLWLTRKEREALIAQDKWCRYRYILDEPNFTYDERLGLQKHFSDFDGIPPEG